MRLKPMVIAVLVAMARIGEDYRRQHGINPVRREHKYSMRT